MYRGSSSGRRWWYGGEGPRRQFNYTPLAHLVFSRPDDEGGGGGDGLVSSWKRKRAESTPIGCAGGGWCCGSIKDDGPVDGRSLNFGRKNAESCLHTATDADDSGGDDGVCGPVATAVKFRYFVATRTSSFR